LFGITAEEDRFQPTLDVPQPLLLPPDRKLVYPWIGWHLVEDDFREMSELNDMGRTEDIALGLNLRATLGFASKSHGSDRDATLLRVDAHAGWEPGGPGRLLLVNAGGSTRDEDSGLVNTQVYFNGRYYRRNLEKHLFSVSLSALATDNLDPEQQVLLAATTVMRVPIRYQAASTERSRPPSSASRTGTRGVCCGSVMRFSPTRAAWAARIRAPHRPSARSTMWASACA
jgi:hypothetical protein